MDININVKAAEDPRDIEVELDGLDDRYVTKNDREIFQVSDKRVVKKAVNKLKKAEERNTSFMPIGAISTCHTPLGSHFAGFSWRDITRMLRPVSWEIIRTHTETNIVATRTFINNTDRTATFNTGLIFNDFHTVTTTKEVRFKSPIKYKVSLPVPDCASEESTTKVVYNTRGEDNHETIPYRGSFSATVEVEPGAERVVNLHVTRCTNELKVTYKATLVGDLACRFLSFLRWYRNHYAMNKVLEAAGVPLMVMATEDIKITYYTGGEVMISE